jgi:bifunctional N-acetylglucosamine-1-phosphate-uridyltransferase/glucosamine-1-phosphate-acetyltransferase GlmU-like protein
METEVKPKEIPVKIETDDVFVLVLLPKLPAFKCENPLEIKICGRSILECTLSAIGELPHKQIPVAKSDDILTLVRNNATDHKYICVIYADTPLLTANTFEQAIAFVKSFGHKAVKMPRGWIFETEFIKSAESVVPEEIPNLPPEDFIVAYSFSQLAIISSVARGRINLKHLSEGVQIIDPNTAYIDAQVTIERGTVIEPNVCIKGETVIGKNCRIGNFAEIKRSQIGEGTKIAHGSYVGDAVIGKNCEIGCGVVFVNYNGKTKSTCTLGNKVFIGSNSTLVAPLALDNNAFVAAGSTITKDVPKHALAIARTVQTIKENYWNVDESETE